MHQNPHTRRALTRSSPLTLAFALILSQQLLADGKVFAPRSYKGSLEERSQEAILVFQPGERDESGKVVGKGARQDLILKIAVEADEPSELRSFGWVVPLPKAPHVAEEDAAIFRECFDYVEARRIRPGRKSGAKGEDSESDAAPKAEQAGVSVISREVVGSFDVAVLKENREGALNAWLERNGFQTLDDGNKIVSWYREKGHVFACMKVNDAQIRSGQSTELHPLRFSFHTGGVDGIFFPMRLTGLQKETFDVNLYVFYGKWINDRLSPFGYVHRGFELHHRDWDTSDCEPNAGKAWSDPANDPYLAPLAHRIPRLTKLFQKLHPGARFYLTQIRARGLEPKEVREWTDDLWLFPYYTDPEFVPYDAREGGPASAAYPDAETAMSGERNPFQIARPIRWPLVAGATLIVLGLGVAIYRRSRA